MATSARAFTLSRNAISPSFNPPYPCTFSRHLLHLPNCRRRFCSPYSATVSCLSGGVSNDDFVSTRKSNFDRGFLVIANMLKRIEPLDTSVISKGISDYAKDSMKQTISTMLGLLPSDQFSITVRLSKQPLHSLLVSSIITGYTLWNAEYRISLVRNFDIPVDGLKRLNFSEEGRVFDKQREEGENEGGETRVEDLEMIAPQVFGDLPREALNYIQQLQSDLSNVKEELNAMKQENMQIEQDRGYRNDLLEYLRSLDPDMVNELSQPSSVEEILSLQTQRIIKVVMMMMKIVIRYAQPGITLQSCFSGVCYWVII
ncbi:Seed maturation-like protein [Melia azedarach]|uniref:Seed maturation-like protein n=1 Tax=Melia azedarach TaxID=155640 RepID=A0ACC1Z111_MELAZ|nr:Seed maturation-like protein [Melia azedarach]